MIKNKKATGRKIGEFKGLEVRAYRPETDEENEERVFLVDGVERGKIYRSYARASGIGWARGTSGESTYDSMMDCVRDILRRAARV